MFYDPRISMGMLFTLIGTILTAFGLSTRSNADMYVKSMGIDANLWWGFVLLVFGYRDSHTGQARTARIDNVAGTKSGNQKLEKERYADP